MFDDGSKDIRWIWSVSKDNHIDQPNSSLCLITSAQVRSNPLMFSWQRNGIVGGSLVRSETVLCRSRSYSQTIRRTRCLWLRPFSYLRLGSSQCQSDLSRRAFVQIPMSLISRRSSFTNGCVHIFHLIVLISIINMPISFCLTKRRFGSNFISAAQTFVFL
jgi:hypothetical protein